MDKTALSKKKGFTPWLVLGMNHPKSITDRSGGIGEERKWQSKFIGKGPLPGHRVHRDSNDLNLVFGKCRKCRPQRLDLLHSSRRVRLRIKEDNGPRSGRRRFQGHGSPPLIGSGECRSPPTRLLRIDILITGTTSGQKNGKAEKNHGLHGRNPERDSSWGQSGKSHSFFKAGLSFRNPSETRKRSISNSVSSYFDLLKNP